jgi:CO dehydrogenase maturation factor
MARTFALAGKGGTGKTTLATLLVRHLMRTRKGSILAVDADPNSVLHEGLGVPLPATVGQITEEMLDSPDSLPGGMSKPQYIEYQIQQVLDERDGYDLLAMGRPEGPGCYCYANNLVRQFMDELTGSYDFVVMDNEAGMEHMSRRTSRDSDVLLLVADPAVRGIRTATRLNELVDELDIGVRERYLVVNGTRGALDPALEAEIEKSGLQLAGTVPRDAAIEAADLAQTGLLGLEDGTPAVDAVGRMLDGVLMGNGEGALAGSEGRKGA